MSIDIRPVDTDETVRIAMRDGRRAADIAVALGDASRALSRAMDATETLSDNASAAARDMQTHIRIALTAIPDAFEVLTAFVTEDIYGATIYRRDDSGAWIVS